MGSHQRLSQRRDAVSQEIYDIEVTAQDGSSATLDEYRGRVMLIVNTASECGFTPQYEGLEELHRRYASRGLSVLAFPCNQFGEQEPGSDADIGAFCQKNYGVTFPVHTKIDVNGANAHPLFQHLTKERPGALGTKRIKWNFTKFLVDAEGKVTQRFAPQTKPADMVEAIEQLLS